MHYPDEKNIHPDTHASTLFPRYLTGLLQPPESKLSEYALQFFQQDEKNGDIMPTERALSLTAFIISPEAVSSQTLPHPMFIQFLYTLVVGFGLKIPSFQTILDNYAAVLGGDPNLMITDPHGDRIKLLEWLFPHHVSAFYNNHGGKEQVHYVLRRQTLEIDIHILVKKHANPDTPSILYQLILNENNSYHPDCLVALQKIFNTVNNPPMTVVDIVNLIETLIELEMQQEDTILLIQALYSPSGVAFMEDRGGLHVLIALMKELSFALSMSTTDTILLIQALCSESGVAFMKHRGGPLGLIALMKELSSKLSIPITDTIPLIGAFCSESGLTFLKHTQATPLIQSIQHLFSEYLPSSEEKAPIEDKTDIKHLDLRQTASRLIALLLRSHQACYLIKAVSLKRVMHVILRYIHLTTQNGIINNSVYAFTEVICLMDWETIHPDRINQTLASILQLVDKGSTTQPYQELGAMLKENPRLVQAIGGFESLGQYLFTMCQKGSSFEEAIRLFRYTFKVLQRDWEEDGKRPNTQTILKFILQLTEDAEQCGLLARFMQRLYAQKEKLPPSLDPYMETITKINKQAPDAIDHLAPLLYSKEGLDFIRKASIDQVIKHLQQITLPFRQLAYSLFPLLPFLDPSDRHTLSCVNNDLNRKIDDQASKNSAAIPTKTTPLEGIETLFSQQHDNLTRLQRKRIHTKTLDNLTCIHGQDYPIPLTFEAILSNYEAVFVDQEFPRFTADEENIVLLELIFPEDMKRVYNNHSGRGAIYSTLQSKPIELVLHLCVKKHINPDILYILYDTIAEDDNVEYHENFFIGLGQTLNTPEGASFIEEVGTKPLLDWIINAIHYDIDEDKALHIIQQCISQQSSLSLTDYTHNLTCMDGFTALAVSQSEIGHSNIKHSILITLSELIVNLDYPLPPFEYTLQNHRRFFPDQPISILTQDPHESIKLLELTFPEDMKRFYDNRGGRDVVWTTLQPKSIGELFDLCIKEHSNPATRDILYILHSVIRYRYTEPEFRALQKKLNTDQGLQFIKTAGLDTITHWIRLMIKERFPANTISEFIRQLCSESGPTFIRHIGDLKNIKDLEEKLDRSKSVGQGATLECIQKLCSPQGCHLIEQVGMDYLTHILSSFISASCNLEQSHFNHNSLRLHHFTDILLLLGQNLSPYNSLEAKKAALASMLTLANDCPSLMCSELVATAESSPELIQAIGVIEYLKYVLNIYHNLEGHPISDAILMVDNGINIFKNQFDMKTSLDLITVISTYPGGCNLIYYLSNSEKEYGLPSHLKHYLPIFILAAREKYSYNQLLYDLSIMLQSKTWRTLMRKDPPELIIDFIQCDHLCRSSGADLINCLGGIEYAITFMYFVSRRFGFLGNENDFFMCLCSRNGLKILQTLGIQAFDFLKRLLSSNNSFHHIQSFITYFDKLELFNILLCLPLKDRKPLLLMLSNHVSILSQFIEHFSSPEGRKSLQAILTRLGDQTILLIEIIINDRANDKLLKKIFSGEGLAFLNHLEQQGHCPYTFIQNAFSKDRTAARNMIITCSVPEDPPEAKIPLPRLEYTVPTIIPSQNEAILPSSVPNTYPDQDLLSQDLSSQDADSSTSSHSNDSDSHLIPVRKRSTPKTLKIILLLIASCLSWLGIPLLAGPIALYGLAVIPLSLLTLLTVYRTPIPASTRYELLWKIGAIVFIVAMLTGVSIVLHITSLYPLFEALGWIQAVSHQIYIFNMIASFISLILVTWAIVISCQAVIKPELTHTQNVHPVETFNTTQTTLLTVQQRLQEKKNLISSSEHNHHSKNRLPIYQNSFHSL